jgi:sodium/potassium-transporting ATPase subunit alpha
MAPDATKKKKKGKKDLSELKRELELDEHKVPIDELYRRYCSDPKKVCLICRPS